MEVYPGIYLYYGYTFQIERAQLVILPLYLDFKGDDGDQIFPYEPNLKVVYKANKENWYQRPLYIS